MVTGHPFPRTTASEGRPIRGGFPQSSHILEKTVGEMIFVMRNCWWEKWCDRKCHCLGLRENQQLTRERHVPTPPKKKILSVYIYAKERGCCGERPPLPWVQISLQSIDRSWQTESRTLGKSWGYIFLFEEYCQIANLDSRSFSAT